MAYQGVRDISFTENVAHVLNGLSLISCQNLLHKFEYWTRLPSFSAFILAPIFFTLGLVVTKVTRKTGETS